MKKVQFLLVAVLAVCLVACGNGKQTKVVQLEAVCDTLTPNVVEEEHVVKESRGTYGANLFIVKGENLYGVRDDEGNVVIPMRYENIVWSTDLKLFYITKDRSYGVALASGEVVIEPRYGNIRLELDCLVCTGDGFFDILSLAHLEVAESVISIKERRYKTYVVRDNSWMMVENAGGWVGAIAADGSSLVPCKYSWLSKHGDMFLTKIEDVWGAVVDNEVLILSEYDNVWFWKNDWVLAKKFMSYFMVNVRTKEAVKLPAEGPCKTFGSYIAVSKPVYSVGDSESAHDSKNFSLYNEKGDEVFKNVWEGYWEAELDHNGEYMLPTGGLIIVGQSEKALYISPDGRKSNLADFLCSYGEGGTAKFSELLKQKGNYDYEVTKKDSVSLKYGNWAF